MPGLCGELTADFRVSLCTFFYVFAVLFYFYFRQTQVSFCGLYFIVPSLSPSAGMKKSLSLSHAHHVLLRGVQTFIFGGMQSVI